MPTFYIKHLTKYSYSGNVIDAANQIMLYPINDSFQKVVNQDVIINSNPKVETYVDFFDNVVGTFMITEPHDFLSIESDIEVITFPKNLPDDVVEVSKQWDELKLIQGRAEFIDYVKFERFSGTEDVLKMISSKDLNTNSPYAVVQDLCEYFFTNFNYVQGLTTVNSTLDEIWEMKAGVCQDFTSVMLQVIRMFGIPARYVSGYISTNDGMTRGEGATHAWVEAYIPFYGWLGFDPTNNVVANDSHVRLAVGRNYSDCSPVKGVFKGKVEDDLFVRVKVSTAKENNESLVFPVSESRSEASNSFQKNLEYIQQQQQQQ